jgi:2,4-dienoyl-CoA reductase-like NADH-dependent reductase (Old Yellow Enzyme family)/thioredoxin reductase
MALTKIFEPIQINKIQIKNRVARTAHGEHLGAHYVSDEFIDYHLARAKGGVGLSIFGVAEVDPSSMGVGGVWSDTVIPRYQELMRALRPHDMKVIQQLWHGGHHYPTNYGGPPPAPSTAPSPFARALIPGVGVPMDRAEIQRIVNAFASGARRVQEGGLHGVEIHGAHSYLIFQFLSPVTNTRTDEYGGSLENRMRFLLEIYQAIRKAVGPDFIVGCRLSATLQKAGLHEAEVNTVALKLEALGLDYISAGIGDYWRIESTLGGMQHPMGYNLPAARKFLKDISIPRIVSGRFRTLEEAEQVLRDGDATLVGLVRALIADPDLVNKTKAGHAQRVRPCIACNQGCIGGIIRGGGLHCTVNPAAGFEGTLAEDLIVRTTSPRKVVVVGGGPGGMEAARIAALSGHNVVLLEASPKLGGAAIPASKPAQPNSIGDIVVWLEAEIYRLEVDVRLNVYAEPAEILAEKPDIVLIATGSRPRKDSLNLMAPGDPIQGVDQAHVLSSTELIMSPPARLGKTAVVLDNVGHFEGIVSALHLIAQGVAVTFITHHRAFAPYVQTTFRDDSLLEKAEEGDFTLLINTVLLEIEKDGCVIRSRSGSRTRVVPADTVVLVTSNEPNRELFDQLQGKATVQLIGDALSPRGMLEAIAEGHRAARAINSMAAADEVSQASSECR